MSAPDHEKGKRPADASPLQRVVRAIAWFVVVVWWLIAAVIVVAMGITVCWMFVEDWPDSLLGCLCAIVLAAFIGGFAWIFCWARRVVVGNGSNTTMSQPGGQT